MTVESLVINLKIRAANDHTAGLGATTLTNIKSINVCCCIIHILLSITHGRTLFPWGVVKSFQVQFNLCINQQINCLYYI